MNRTLLNLTGNSILITGGGSGIGRALAESFHALGNQVIIAGRRTQVLEEVTAANPGMDSVTLNMEDAANIRAVASQVTVKHPALNVLINNAGIMKLENLLAQQDDLADAEAIVVTNLLGPIRMIAALLPHLQKQAASTIINVSSGLAFVPLAPTPTYNATKAAIHSYTLSLRYQLRGKSTEVLELIPPYVQTDLLGGAEDPRAMPLKAFVTEVMDILKTKPGAIEICVEKVNGLRLAAESGRFDAVFNGLNESMALH